jgi:peroxiredoxin
MIVCAMFLMAFAGEQLTGTRAPEWKNTEWINSPPLSLSQLRGKVVLIRFFMESTCPMCRGSAPYLNQVYKEYADDGLVVIGMYTPKPAPKQTDISLVKGYVKDYGFQFPIALDNDWATLKKYWLDRVPNADYTSVSFLLDRNGIIRMIHPGGLYSSEDAAALQKKIEELLKEQVRLTKAKP